MFASNRPIGAAFLVALLQFQLHSADSAPCSVSTTVLSSPPTKADLFWSSRDRFLAAHVGDDSDDCQSASSDQLKATDNFQFMRRPNEHQWEAEHLRGSRKHKIYRQLRYDHSNDRAESVAQWTDEDENSSPSGYGAAKGPYQLGKQVIIWT